MKKILCAFIAALMLAAQCAVYAETDTAVNNIAADSNIELMAIPVDDIVGEGDNKLIPDEAEQIEAAVAEAVKEAEPPEEITEQERMEISVDGFDITASDAAMKIALNFLADNPEYFYFDDKTVSCATVGEKTSKLYIYYTHNASETKTIQSELDEVTDEILMQMRKDGIDLDAIKSGTDEGKKQAQFDAALWVHDYLADTITYDYRAFDEAEEDKVKRSIDAALLGERLTVCEGYAKSYKYILEKIGMECINVYSSLERHEWSAVKIGDAWYCVDVTQDDSDTIKNINHNFFLVTEEELLGRGTHRGGYITELDESTMTFGTEFEGALWHGNWQTAEDGLLEWNDSVIESKVIFDGGSRYYCGYDDSDNTDIYTAIYKCGAQLDDPTVLCRVEDGLWFIGAETRSFIRGYHGGMGKRSIVDGDSQKTYLYFNSPKVIYKLETEEGAQPEKVFEYTPTESENYNCMFGIMVDGAIRYAYADMINDENGLRYENINIGEVKPDIYTVDFYDAEDAENVKLIASVEAKPGQKLNAPDYTKYGYVITGWSRDTDGGDMWDFENDTVTENIKLYVSAEEAKMGEQPLRIDARSGKLLGTLNASIVGFDDTYREAPTYMLAIYDNNALVAVKTSNNGEFSIAPEDNIPYTETTAVKIYAWSSEYEPYLDGASVQVIEDLTGGDGEDEGDTESGDSETGGDVESGENTDSGETGE